MSFLEISYVPKTKINDTIIKNTKKDRELYDINISASKDLKQVKQFDSTCSIKADINLDKRQATKTHDINTRSKINLSIGNINKTPSKMPENALNQDIFDEEEGSYKLYFIHPNKAK